MENLFKFINQLGELKSEGRRGWKIHDIDNAETTAAHIFQTAMLVWVVGKKKEDIHTNKAIKMALMHDICEVHSPDLTSYDAVAIDEEEEFTKEDVKDLEPEKGRPTTEQRIKMKKVKSELEDEAMDKLISELYPELQNEFESLWQEHEEGSSPESQLVNQADEVINLLQGMEYWKEGNKDISYELWVRRAKETLDIPELVEMLEEIEKSL